MVVGVAGFAAFAVPVLARVLNVGNVFGMVVFALVFLYGLFLPRANAAIAHAWQGVPGKVAIIAVAALVVAFVVFACVSLARINEASDRAPAQNATAIVLGCRVRDGRPSLAMQRRLDAAYDYLVANPGAECILSGGQGPDEAISEAQCMRDTLVAMGIDPARLHMEDQSTNTRENLAYSLAVLHELGLGTEVAIVTDPYHQYRSQKIARELGLSPGAVCADTALWLAPTFYLRELLCIAYDDVLGQATA